jgi:ABC-type dipeptide/oligopeptide/nickel transport system permease subunit
MSPGVAIALLALGVNFPGIGWRDLTDPKGTGR